MGSPLRWNLPFDPYVPLPFPVKQPWEATWWVQFLQSLGEPFPKPDSPEFDHFLARSSTWPALLLLAGAAVIAGVLLCSCLCHPEGRRRHLQRPSSKTTVFVAFLLLLLAGLGTSICWRTGVRAADTAEDQLSRAITDLSTASQEGSTLLTVGDRIMGALGTLTPSCPPQVRPQVQQQVDELIQDLQHYQSELQRYQEIVRPLPQQLTDVKELGRKFALIISVGLFTPMALAVLCCLLVLVAISCTRSARCTGSALRCLGCCLFAPTILLVTVAAAAQLEVGIVTSSFCLDVDNNALAYIERATGKDSTTFAISEYYIQQQGSNPLLQAIDNAGVQLQKVNQTMTEYGGLIAQQCPSWDGAETVTSGLATAQAGLATGEQLLSPANIYPYYQQAIRQDACQTVVIGLGWLVVFQVAVGLVCLPCLTGWSNCYFKARAQWYDQRTREAAERIWVPGP